MIKNKSKNKSKQISKKTIVKKHISTKTKNNLNDNDTPTNHENNEIWSKSKKKRMRKRKGLANKEPSMITDNSDKVEKELHVMVDNTNESSKTNTINKNKNSKKKKESILESYKKRLTGARFRTLNEDLYTKPSKKSFETYKKHPELFEQYHTGFRNQVESWPENPVDIILQSILSHYEKQPSKKLIISDFGCGDAKLASKLAPYKEIEIHSFDFVKQNEYITQADMCNVPLQNNYVDIGVICLALMGTNIPDFIREAYRVLKPNGLLKIAEVRSRFESSSDDGDDKGGGVKEFLKCMKLLGFTCKSVDRSNKMFFIMNFLKNVNVKPSLDVTFTARPCIYKRR